VSAAIAERAEAQPRASRACPHCAAPLADDQEWCVECGTATTVIHRSPSWWLPVAVVAAVIALAVTGFIVALNSATGTYRLPAQGSPLPVSTGGLTKISEWPPGLTGWTVVLSHTPNEAVAYSKATTLARAGIPAGVIDSSHHPGWLPGYWVVFSGRYSTQQRAQAAASALHARGHHGAHPKLVAP
jgi:hypothetical protein